MMTALYVSYYSQSELQVRACAESGLVGNQTGTIQASETCCCALRDCYLLLGLLPFPLPSYNSASVNQGLSEMALP